MKETPKGDKSSSMLIHPQIRKRILKLNTLIRTLTCNEKKVKARIYKAYFSVEKWVTGEKREWKGRSTRRTNKNRKLARKKDWQLSDSRTANSDISGKIGSVFGKTTWKVKKFFYNLRIRISRNLQKHCFLNIHHSSTLISLWDI